MEFYKFIQSLKIFKVVNEDYVEIPINLNELETFEFTLDNIRVWFEADNDNYILNMDGEMLVNIESEIFRVKLTLENNVIYLAIHYDECNYFIFKYENIKSFKILTNKNKIYDKRTSNKEMLNFMIGQR